MLIGPKETMRCAFDCTSAWTVKLQSVSRRGKKQYREEDSFGEDSSISQDDGRNNSGQVRLESYRWFEP